MFQCNMDSLLLTSTSTSPPPPPPPSRPNNKGALNGSVHGTFRWDSNNNHIPSSLQTHQSPLFSSNNNTTTLHHYQHHHACTNQSGIDSIFDDKTFGFHDVDDAFGKHRQDALREPIENININMQQDSDLLLNMDGNKATVAATDSCIHKKPSNIMQLSNDNNENNSSNNNIDVNDSSPYSASPSPPPHKLQQQQHRVDTSKGPKPMRASCGKSSKNKRKSCGHQKKPTGAPKRPLSGYNIYFQEQRQELQQSGAGLGFEELAKFVGKKWQSMSVKEKMPYENKADKDKERYRKEIETWNIEKKKRLKEAEMLSLQRNLQHLSDSLFDATTATPDPSSAINFPPLQCSQQQQQQQQQQGVRQSIANDDSDFNYQQRGACTQIDTQRCAHSPSVETSPTAARPSMSVRHDDIVPFQSQGGSSSTSQFRPTADYPFGPPPPSPLEAIQVSSEGVTIPPDVIPPGMEIILQDDYGNDKKYRVYYRCYWMSQDAATRYLDSISSNNTGTCSNNVSATDYAPPALTTAPQHHIGNWGHPSYSQTF